MRYILLFRMKWFFFLINIKKKKMRRQKDAILNDLLMLHCSKTTDWDDQVFSKWYLSRNRASILASAGSSAALDNSATAQGEKCEVNLVYIRLELMRRLHSHCATSSTTAHPPAHSGSSPGAFCKFTHFYNVILKKPGSYFQNLIRAGSFRAYHLSIYAKIMEIGPVERSNELWQKV